MQVRDHILPIPIMVAAVILLIACGIGVVALTKPSIEPSESQTPKFFATHSVFKIQHGTILQKPVCPLGVAPATRIMPDSEGKIKSGIEFKSADQYAPWNVVYSIGINLDQVTVATGCEYR